jgi:hypothetical protein
MFVLSGCQLGTGKTLLCDVANVIAHGRSLARRIYPARPEDLEKLLDAALLGGDEVVCFDNVDLPLHGAPLDALLTATDGKKIRRMHSHQEILIEHRPVMIANGNWVRVHGDTSRRVLRFGLKAYGHGADRRGDLKISDLRKHLGERRKQWIVLVVKALRLALKIDRSKWKTANWGSFEGFCAVLEATHKLTGVDASACRLKHDDRLADVVRILAELERCFPDQRFLLKDALFALESVHAADRHRLVSLSKRELQTALEQSGRVKWKQSKFGRLYFFNGLVC